MPDSPSLPAIRERAKMTEPDLDAIRRRLEKAETQSRASLLADALALLSLVARLQGERETNQRALATAYTRLEILLGRMRACHEESGAHAVTLIEVPGWLEEMDAARAALGEESG